MDNPHVGEHLQDHPFYLLNWETTARGTLAEAETPKQLFNYFFRGRGLLTSTVAEATAFFRTHDDLEAPDLQFHLGAAYFHNHGFDTHDKPAFAIAPTLVAPQSRGHVRLRSADPTEAPSIVGNHLTERADVDAMLIGRRAGARGRVTARPAPLHGRRRSTPVCRFALPPRSRPTCAGTRS